MDQDQPGWIVVARDSDNDEFERHFAVHISDEDDAIVAELKIAPEQSCFALRPLTADEIANLGLIPDEVRALTSGR
jgi:hypothetical protein